MSGMRHLHEVGRRLAGVALAAALALCVAACDDEAADTATGDAPDNAETTTPAQHPRPRVGFALSLHHTTELHVYTDAVDDIAALGFEAVKVVTPMFQDDGASNDIAIDPARCPSRKQLVALLSHARQRGMHVSLMPIVLFRAPRDGEWRGKLQPDDWSAWWASYRDMMDYFVGVANASDVDVLSVGSELLSTEKRRDRWSELIAHVRKRYDGQLTYSTNWDSYDKPTFWDRVDIINAYWDLTRDAEHDPPTDADLIARWLAVQGKLAAFARDVKRPIMFTEVGYPSLPWALAKPWNYVAEDDAKADHAAQRRGYASFLAAWSPLLDRPIDVDVLAAHGFDIDRLPTPAHSTLPDGKPLLHSVHFYSWEPHNKHPGTSTDTGFGVRNKPALGLLRASMDE